MRSTSAARDTRVTIRNRRVEHEGFVFHWDGKVGNGKVKVYRVYGDVNRMPEIMEALELDVAVIDLAQLLRARIAEAENTPEVCKRCNTLIRPEGGHRCESCGRDI